MTSPELLCAVLALLLLAAVTLAVWRLPPES